MFEYIEDYREERPDALPLWINGEWDPKASPGCDKCLMGVCYGDHDTRAFNTMNALKGVSPTRDIPPPVDYL